jgi:predicted Zn-dependent peptidase
LPKPLADVETSPAAEPAAQPAAEPQALVFPEEAFRAQPPAAGAPRAFRLPPVQAFTLASGIQVYLVEQHALPLVSIDLNFDGGAAADPPGKEGLASVCMAMLTEGTEQLDKLAYAERLADTASSIGGYAGDDSVGLTLSSLSRHLDATFAQFVDTLCAPGFRQADFDRLIRRRIEGIKQSRSSPASIASRVSGAVLYGPAHPLGAVVTEASLAALTLDDCRAFARTWLRPAAARLFVVGDLTEAAVRAGFDSPRLAGWTGAAPALPELPAPRTLPGRIFWVDVPGAVQSTVSYLQLGPSRGGVDYFATAMMSAVFGGAFTSRINMNLREAKGYSYSARGGFTYTRSHSVFAVRAQVTAGATYPSILEIYREVAGLWRRDPDFEITRDELAREQSGAILGLPGRFATAQAALGQYRALVYFGLPLDYYDSYVDNVRKVTVADVMLAAATELDPRRAVYVVVGDGAARRIAVPDTTGERSNDALDAPSGARPTLREALADLAARGDVGDGGLVELDADGCPRGEAAQISRATSTSR